MSRSGGASDLLWAGARLEAEDLVDLVEHDRVVVAEGAVAVGGRRC